MTPLGPARVNKDILYQTATSVHKPPCALIPYNPYGEGRRVMFVLFLRHGILDRVVALLRPMPSDRKYDKCGVFIVGARSLR